MAIAKSTRRVYNDTRATCWWDTGSIGTWLADWTFTGWRLVL